MATDDYLADYARLGLQPGCSLHTLERTWRQAVSALHPDRAAAGADPILLGRRMHELSAAYRRLRQFEREHGRLPGAPLVPAQSEPQVDPSSTCVISTEAAPSAVPTAARGGWKLPAMVLAVSALLALWGVESEDTGPGRLPTPDARPLPPPAAAMPPPSVRDLRPEAVAASTPHGLRRIRIGTTEAEVERLMGPPIVGTPTLWEYGPSHVRFERGRVVGWYSSPLQPLPVDSDQR
jgi:hypothetical protein